MKTATVTAQSKIICNRCSKAFEAPREMQREFFAGQKAARIQEFCTCPHCQQTDGHWVYASDVMPVFGGGFEARKRAERNWLNNH